MTFASRVWHLLVAIKDGLVLLFMLLFFLALYGVLAGRPGNGRVHSGALLVKLDGALVEEPAKVDPLAALTAPEAPIHEYRTRDVVRAIRAAASDDRIKAVVLDLSRFTGGGLVHLEEVGAAMDEVRAAKKPVLTYGDAYGNSATLLAAHASEAWVDPLGGAFISGFGGNSLYMGTLLERLKINVHVFKVGTYKDFVEPYVRDGMSDPSREARKAVIEALWGEWKANVAHARPKAQIDRITSDPVGWIKASDGDSAKATLAAGVVDRIGDRVAFGERIKALVGADPASDRPGAFAHTSLAAMEAAHGENHAGRPVAVVTVAGEIVDGKAGPGTAGGDRIARLIDQATADEAPALVLRVDSPGGSVFASEQIRLALERFKAKGAPVVVSMANMAASGGYWVSTPGSKLFAEPGTVTGSIGIFAVMPSFERLLGANGVKADGVGTTSLSGQPDIAGGFSPEAEALFQAGIESGYARFIGLVAKSRGKTPEAVDKIAQGRVWDGGTARQLGLVDGFGGLDDAIAEAARAAKLSDWHPAFYGRVDGGLGGWIERIGEDDPGAGGGADDALSLAARAEQRRVALALAQLQALVASPRGAQALCLDCPLGEGASAPHAAAEGIVGALFGRIL